LVATLIVQHDPIRGKSLSSSTRADQEKRFCHNGLRRIEAVQCRGAA
jgi:hypothetical protein